MVYLSGHLLLPVHEFFGHLLLRIRELRESGHDGFAGWLRLMNDGVGGTVVSFCHFHTFFPCRRGGRQGLMLAAFTKRAFLFQSLSHELIRSPFPLFTT